MDNYKKDEENDVHLQSRTGPDQGGFIELSSHKHVKDNLKSGCCS